MFILLNWVFLFIFEVNRKKLFIIISLFYRKAINSEVQIQCENGEKRVLRSTCDWNEGAINADHLWSPTSASGDFCYVGDDNCCVSTEMSFILLLGYELTR